MTPFTRIDNELTTDKVYKELKDAILRRTLAPGQKLDIFKLAEQFNVSRTPVKEAFNRLHLEGLLVIKPRKGTYVAEIDMRKVLEVLDARLLFETWAAKIGVPNATTEQLGALRELFRQMDEIYAAKPFDFTRYNELDIRFHYQIVAMGQNCCILELYQKLNAHKFTERAFFDDAYEIIEKSTHHQHLAIVQAYEKQDLLLVLDLITAHIQFGSEKVLREMK